MPQAGDIIAADHVNWAQTQFYEGEASGSLGASKSAVAIPGISVAFTTETAGATLDISWTIRADPTGASTAIISARPLVVGPASFSQQPNVFSLQGWAAGAANDVSTPGNGAKMTLGAAGNYTVTLLGTTAAAQDIGQYSTVRCRVTEVLP
jgi:hypothetical protein